MSGTGEDTDADSQPFAYGGPQDDVLIIGSDSSDNDSNSIDGLDGSQERTQTLSSGKYDRNHLHHSSHASPESDAEGRGQSRDLAETTSSAANDAAAALVALTGDSNGENTKEERNSRRKTAKSEKKKKKKKEKHEKEKLSKDKSSPAATQDETDQVASDNHKKKQADAREPAPKAATKNSESKKKKKKKKKDNTPSQDEIAPDTTSDGKRQRSSSSLTATNTTTKAKGGRGDAVIVLEAEDDPTEGNNDEALDFIPLDTMWEDKANDGGRNPKKRAKRQQAFAGTNAKTDGDCFTTDTPWMGKNTHLSSIPIIRLHQEIKLFMDYIHPTPEEVYVRQYMVERITKIVHDLWPKAKVEVFGSYSTGLYLPTSDIDFVITGSWPKLPLNTLAHAIERERIADKMEVIAKARVPIVKFRDRVTQINIDISFNQPNGPEDASRIKRWLKQYPDAGPLVMIIKRFLAQRDLHEPFHGGIGSYAVFLLVLSYLQRRPLVTPAGKGNLGVMLIEFLELYGRHFNYGHTGISVRGDGKYFDKLRQGFSNSKKATVMCIENPSAPQHDVTGNAFSTPAIREVFEHAYSVLSCAMSERRPPRYTPPTSYLGDIIQIDGELQAYRSALSEIARDEGYTRQAHEAK